MIECLTRCLIMFDESKETKYFKEITDFKSLIV